MAGDVLGAGEAFRFDQEALGGRAVAKPQRADAVGTASSVAPTAGASSSSTFLEGSSLTWEK